ncbi:MAG: GntR family transcriptional regulator [Chitinivibrionales bacterium]|nr:GntR family transcriptional regulator [Chitinivibrionales bacterium]
MAATPFLTNDIRFMALRWYTRNCRLEDRARWAAQPMRPLWPSLLRSRSPPCGCAALQAALTRCFVHTLLPVPESGSVFDAIFVVECPHCPGRRAMVTEPLERWLESAIRDLPPGSRLPSERELARSFGLAKATVERVVRRFRERGAVVRYVGKGTFTAGKVVAHAPVPAGTTADSIESALAELVSSGAVRTGDALPSVKELCVRFGVSRASVRTACDRLVSRRLAVKLGRGYFAGPSFERVLGSARGGDYHLFMRGEPDFSRIYRHDFLAPAYCAMERVLLSYGATMHYHSIEALDGLVRSWILRKQRPAGVLLACVEGGVIEQVAPAMGKLVGDRRRAHVRVLTDVRTGNFSTVRSFGEVVSRGHINTIAARTVAGLLNERRFEQVHFFFDARQAMWDYSGPAWPIIKLRAELGALTRMPGISFAVVGNEDLSFDALFNLPRAVGVIEQRLGKHRKVGVETLRREVVFASSLSPLLRRCTEADLWVFSSAMQAAEALGVAVDRGKRVPSDLSILCLEDDPYYYHLGLSYCGPDFDRIGYLMAHCLIGDIPVARSGQGLMSASAVLVDKQTTRRR